MRTWRRLLALLPERWPPTNFSVHGVHAWESLLVQDDQIKVPGSDRNTSSSNGPCALMRYHQLLHLGSLSNCMCPHQVGSRAAEDWASGFCKVFSLLRPLGKVSTCWWLANLQTAALCGSRWVGNIGSIQEMLTKFRKSSCRPMGCRQDHARADC